jgi:hypothetical protein
MDASVVTLRIADVLIVAGTCSRVVMENRSFDHMLGYLRNDGMRGVVGDESNLDASDIEHRVYEYPPEPFPDSFDPCHAPCCVAKQLEAGHEMRLHDFQADLLKAALLMRHAGLRPGAP